MITDVLIVESDEVLAAVWQRHMMRHGVDVSVSNCQSGAVELIRMRDFGAIIISLDLETGSALAVADFASYRRPDARLIFVTRSGFFSDGSIFELSPNAAAYVTSRTPPEDIAAIVEHHATR